MRLFCGSLTHILPVAPAGLFTGWRRDVAERKARLLLDAGANVTVNALDFTPQFQVWADSQMLTLVQGEFIPSLLDTCWLAIAATDNETVNQQVSDAAEARRIFCNVVDAPRQASFIMPSIIDRSPLMVAVSSGGTSPVLARLLREKLESVLPLHLGSWPAMPAICARALSSSLPAWANAAAFGRSCL
ncbi:Siroheme synthase / Precorrin-2 oxidase [Klebsiella variicola]|nr:Siroheme synthase / Precorrin-2 oxidase [Klebsiella variicola]